MKVEDNLILHLTCMALNLPAYQSAEYFDGESIDWEYFTNASVQHGLFLLIYQCLVDCKSIVLPEEYKIKFKQLKRELVIQSLSMSAELIRIYDVLATLNISVVPFKGPTLSLAVYGKLDLRIFGDLDILVKIEDIENVIKCLIERGYSPLVELDSDQLKKYIIFENDMQLSHPKGTVVEVHWEASGRYTSNPIDYSYLESRIIDADFHGKKMQQFGYEDLMIYLCLHGTRHSWERLEWLCSVASLLLNKNILNFTEVFARSKKMGCRKIVLQSFVMAQEVFSVDLPQDVEELVRNEKKYLGIACYNKKRLFPLHGSGNFAKKGHRFKLFQFVLRDKWTGSVTYLFKQLFGLRVADIQFVRLPSMLFPLYYLVRPYRLILKGLKNL